MYTTLISWVDCVNVCTENQRALESVVRPQSRHIRCDITEHCSLCNVVSECLTQPCVPYSDLAADCYDEHELNVVVVSIW